MMRSMEKTMSINLNEYQNLMSNIRGQEQMIITMMNRIEVLQERLDKVDKGMLERIGRVQGDFQRFLQDQMRYFVDKSSPGSHETRFESFERVEPPQHLGQISQLNQLSQLTQLGQLGTSQSQSSGHSSDGSRNLIPDIRLNRRVRSVQDVWEEWHKGYKNNPPLKDLEKVYKAKWRRGTISKTAQRRKKIVEAIEHAINVEMLDEFEALRRLEEFRVSRKKSMFWLYNNVPSSLRDLP
ncbi:unnamed protein product [Kuraishia capsulata CBS 1993]|uniref:Transcription activator GCR1-like domain-containing protein n=1 Tax=Kuraishia capsulata CBS 1993 TaxID=1382522 RepID=W6MVP5_9ASCO|nr:uncharacterized protein KUCA_T00006037001 [Kuraishia capsulata CBS 1993]CDK30042.1 unnamed protein product [Kuraishia capsulata CBS 1993]